MPKLVYTLFWCRPVVSGQKRNKKTFLVINTKRTYCYASRIVVVLVLYADGKWSCQDGRRFIGEEYVCDGRIHCTDGSDEWDEMCKLWQCPARRWKCLSGQCISDSWVCDGNPDPRYKCVDRSDEADDICKTWNCSEGRWKCPNTNKCIPTSAVCDGVTNVWYDGCGDFTDEDPVLCKNWICAKGFKKCHDNKKCLNELYWCDGAHGVRYGCADRSDEAHCENWTCPDGMWRCRDGKGCVYNNAVCDGFANPVTILHRGCRDGSEEEPEHCKNWKCPEGYWKCDVALTCLREDAILNGNSMCPYGRDEDPKYHIGRKCSKGYVMCNETVQCIQETQWCDGQIISNGGDSDCQDGSDEGPHCQNWDCLPDDWKCRDNLQCISVDSVCDGEDHCHDKSDEHNELCGYCMEGDQWPWLC